jgi:NHL repeat
VYIADCEKSHISKWPGSTRVAGLGKCGKTLNRFQCRSAVSNARDGSKFIADTCSHRIMHWHPNGPSGVRLAGCCTIQENKTDQLTQPNDVTFDWEGSLLVADTGNNRVQRFDLCIDPVCGKYRVVIHQ